MNKRLLTFLWFSISIAALLVQSGYAKDHHRTVTPPGPRPTANQAAVPDSAADRVAVIKIIHTVIKASSTFDIDAVANLYTPNAVIADEEPPFSWNGPTAGVQWVNTVEKTCKDYKLKEFSGKIGRISVYLKTDESIYVVVPVDYTGEIKGDHFEEEGAFTFVFRMVSGQWMIKSQVWVARKGL
jgi:ketosteroid isomerase-like protein